MNYDYESRCEVLKLASSPTRGVENIVAKMRNCSFRVSSTIITCLNCSGMLQYNTQNPESTVFGLQEGYRSRENVKGNNNCSLCLYIYC